MISRISIVALPLVWTIAFTATSTFGSPEVSAVEVNTILRCADNTETEEGAREETHDKDDRHKEEPKNDNDWADEIMAFYKKNAPEFTDELDRLKKSDHERVRDFWEAMCETYKAYVDEHERDEDTAERYLSHQRLDLRSHILGHNIRMLHEQNKKKPTKDSVGQMKKLQTELRELLGSIFDLRSQIMADELSKLERESQKLITRLEKREDNRVNMIEKRLNMLSGSDEELEW